VTLGVIHSFLAPRGAYDERSSAPTAAAAIAMFAAALWCIPASATPSVPAAGVPGAAASAPMASVQVLVRRPFRQRGRGVVPVHVLVLDAQGKSVPAGGIVRATIVHGSATFDITASPGAAYVTARFRPIRLLTCPPTRRARSCCRSLRG